MQLKNFEEASVVAIRESAETRLLSTAVKYMEDKPELADKLTDIAKHNNYEKIEEIGDQLDPQDLATIFPLYACCK